MELLAAILDLEPAQLIVAALAICIVFSGSASSMPEDEDDNSDYDNASWNPASVNYNG